MFPGGGKALAGFVGQSRQHITQRHIIDAREGIPQFQNSNVQSFSVALQLWKNINRVFLHLSG